MLNAEVAARRTDAISTGIGVQTQIYVDRALNSEVWDIEGNRYIDFAAGIAVVNTGHCHPKVMAAVTEQLSRFTHTCHQVLPYENYVRLAERLNAAVPGNWPKKTVFVTTGAEAIENAIKVARIATGRNAVIAFGGAFHGRTFLGMSLTGKVEPYKKGFGAMMPDVYHVPFPQEVHNVTTADAMAGITKLFKADLDPARITYPQLLERFFKFHDPTQLNRQGPDYGEQYRSAIFTFNETQKKTAETVKARVNASGKWRRPVVTEIATASIWYSAEGYHQKYLLKNPGGYTCHFMRD
jgi:methionine-S-sulfoxide reductase